jgi:MFS family permease
MALYAAAMLWSYFAVAGPLGFEIALIAHGVISGTYFTIASGMPALLYPKAKFSQYCSASGIVASLGGMALGPILGLLLDWSGHNYRNIFIAGFILMALALAISIPVYLKFLALGGKENYVAPELQPVRAGEKTLSRRA